MKFIKKNIPQKINLFLYNGIEADQNREVLNRDVIDKAELGNLASNAVTGETEERLREVIDGPIILENLLYEYFKEFSVEDLNILEVKLKTVKAAGSLLLWYAKDNNELLSALKSNPELLTEVIKNKGAMRYIKNLDFFKAQGLWTQENEDLAYELDTISDKKMRRKLKKV